MVDVFLLLLGYYVLKTVREPMILASAAADLELLREAELPDWLRSVLMAQGGPQLKAAAAACQSLLLIGFVPLYAWFSSSVSRLWLLVGVTLFFISNLLLFYLAAMAGLPFIGFFFFVWVGIFSVAMVAQFWSLANDVYPRAAGERLFPIVAIGATAGAPAGAWIGGTLSAAEWPAAQLILLTVGLLLAYLALSLVVHFREIQSARMRAQGQELPLDSGGGFSLVFKNPFILGIGIMLLLLNLVNTTGENILSGLVVDAALAANPGGDIGPWIGAFYGQFYFYVNIAAFLIQALVVSRIVKRFGIRAVVLALPVVAFGAYGLIGLGVGLTVVRWTKSAENATDYSIMNTAKAMLWLPTTREEKYKAKQAVDTIFVRIGDLGAALIFIVATTALHLSVRSLALFNLGVIALWITVAQWVLRRHRALVGAEANDPAQQR